MQKQNFTSAPVCLIRPPTFTTINNVGQDATPPLGLAYLASSLESAGYSVFGLDAVGEAVNQYTILDKNHDGMLHGLTNEQIIERIPSNTEIIGVTCMFSVEWPYTLPILEGIRRKFPNALIVIGGEHVTACYEYILDTCPFVDVCVLGEGEETFVDLINAYYSIRPLNEVAGISFKQNDQVVRTDTRKRIFDIDQIPQPNWDIFPIEAYIDNALTHGANLGRCMPIMASRGCPYQCTFCSSPQMWTRKWNVRDPEDVLAEMKKYMKKYNVTNFDFYDLTAIIRKEWIVKFCSMLINERLNITWQLPTGTRSEAIDNEVCDLLYRSGCRHMSYAPESGSPDELKRIKKQIKLDKMLDSMRSAYKNKIQIKCNFIFGLPGATWKDVFKTYKFITQLAVIGVEDISAFPFSPYPGSTLFTMLEKEGKVKLCMDYFRSLSGFTDFMKGTSMNDTFTPRVLGFLNFFTMSYFYLLSFICHPKRIFKFIYYIIVKDTSTRLTISTSHVARKMKAKKQSDILGKQTITINSTLKPRAFVKPKAETALK